MQKMRFLSVLILFSVLFKSYCQKNLENDIDSLLSVYDSDSAPGLVVGVMKNDSVLYSKGFGLANLDYGIKNSDSSVFDLASVSKQFTAAAVWHLIDNKKLKLNQDLSDILVDFPKYEQPLKIRHLLNHTSGIRNYHTLMALSGFDYNTEYYDNHTVYDLAKRQRNLNNIPGEKVIYSNTNYNILALVVEKISGQDLGTYLSENIFDKLDMTDSSVRINSGLVIKNRAIGYQKRDSDYSFNTSSQSSYGAGKVMSNLNDMFKWLSILNDRVSAYDDLSDFLKKRDTTLNGKRANYARGLSFDNYLGHETYSHGGYSFGGQSFLLVVPELNIGIIVISNLQSIAASPIAYQILNFTLPDSDREPSQVDETEDLALESKPLRSFIGDYIEVNSDLIMSVSLNDGVLSAKSYFGDKPVDLNEISANKFSRVNAPNVKYDFNKSNDYDLSVSFGGTPFYFKKTKVESRSNRDIEKFTGIYYSQELDVSYMLAKKNGSLTLSYPKNDSITLFPIKDGTFGNRNRTLYEFNISKDGLVNGFLLSCDGQVKDIEFKRIHEDKI